MACGGQKIRPAVAEGGCRKPREPQKVAQTTLRQVLAPGRRRRAWSGDPDGRWRGGDFAVPAGTGQDALAIGSARPRCPRRVAGQSRRSGGLTDRFFAKFPPSILIFSCRPGAFWAAYRPCGGPAVKIENVLLLARCCSPFPPILRLDYYYLLLLIPYIAIPTISPSKPYHFTIAIPTISPSESGDIYSILWISAKKSNVRLFAEIGYLGSCMGIEGRLVGRIARPPRTSPMRSSG